ncbi:MAG TPA: DoxX family protein [Acidobacteriaceae bacterium]|jgi:thiosulfate dehydrogenase [quinone] large subunit
MSDDSNLWRKDATRGYALLRVTLGLNICLHGVVRWVGGLRGFAESLVPMFQKTPLPSWSVYGFGYLLPVLEAIVGALVLFGFQTRRALILGAALMLVLTFGSALRQDWPTAGIQLTYSLAYCVLVAGAQMNGYSLDHIMHRAM